MINARDQSIINVNDLKEGDKIRADAGFPCIESGDVKTVKRDAKGLFIMCYYGRHGLDGQLCKAGEHGVDFPHYIGFYKAQEGVTT